MSIPTPADLAVHRRPAGAAGGVGGQFAGKKDHAPAQPLTAGRVLSPDDLPIPDLTDPLPEYVHAADMRLRGEYRELWKRMNAKHRSATYGTARTLAVHSTDPAELAVLSALQVGDAAVNVARNPAAPGPVLHMLAVGESDWRDPEARRAAVAHPNCPEETIRIVWAHRRVVDFQGVGAPAVPTAPNTPIDILEEAAAEGDAAAAERLRTAR